MKKTGFARTSCCPKTNTGGFLYFRVSLDESALVVETLQQAHIGDEHVVRLVHRCHAVLDLTGMDFATDEAGAIAKLVPTLRDGVAAVAMV